MSPTLKGGEGDFYFFVLFVSTVLGAKGWILIREFANTLSDTSMEVNENGRLDYHKNIFH